MKDAQLKISRSEVPPSCANTMSLEHHSSHEKVDFQEFENAPGSNRTEAVGQVPKTKKVTEASNGQPYFPNTLFAI